VTQDGKLSLPAAILINLNIMLGAGIFLNTVKLSKWAGALGCLMYPLIGLLMLPLIISIAKLVHIYPEEGFYGYAARSVHPFVGFFSSWAYFTGKLASAMLMIHVALSLVHQIVPLLQHIPLLALDFGVLVFFIMLNMLNVKTGSKIQVWFMVLKIIPIFFAIFSGFYLFSWRNYTLANLQWAGIPSSLPLVLYAVSGFEAACSLSCQIRDAKRNGPLAIYISYGIMLTIAFVYQFVFYGAAGNALASLQEYTGIFPLLLGILLPGYNSLAMMLQIILYCAIAASALGAGYGILFSNPWNLYAMARHGHVILPNVFTKLNRYGLPIWCIITEGVICTMYLVVTQGDQLPLQQTSALACSIAYTISVISLLFLVLYHKTVTMRSWIPLLALINCCLLVGSCVRNFILFGAYPLLLFMAFLLLGLSMFVYTSKINKTQQL
jgi:APA family basic amino acid/polyamine antiporter